MAEGRTQLTCVFRYCLEKHNANKVTQLRELVAKKIQLDEITYNEGILGKKPAEYAKWILLPKSWGGAVELSIFSEEYKCEIVVRIFGVQTLFISDGIFYRFWCFFSGT